MTKHVAETLAAIPGLVPGADGVTLAEHVRAWTSSNADAAEPLLKLGGKWHSDKEKAQRVKVRACILTALAFGQKNARNAEAYAEELKEKTDVQLIGELRTYLSSCAQREGTQLFFGPSFKNSPATAPIKDKCQAAYGLAKAYVADAIRDLTKVRSADGASYARFRAYFGDYSTNTVATVLANLNLINTNLANMPLWLYYRGQTVATFSQANDWPFLIGDLGVGSKISVGHHYGATLRPQQRQNHWRPANPLQQRDDLHVMVGTLSEPAESKVVAGMLIHELSHYLCDTRDVKIPLVAHPFVNTPHVQTNLGLMSKILGNQDGYFLKKDDGTRQLITRAEWVADKQKLLPQRQFARRKIDDAYGQETCTALAQMLPEKALANADNYSLYCLQFAA